MGDSEIALPWLGSADMDREAIGMGDSEIALPWLGGADLDLEAIGMGDSEIALPCWMDRSFRHQEKAVPA
jgi:hypothetical protein